MWRSVVCIGLVMLIITTVTIIIGIVGCVLAGAIISEDEKSESEMQAARIILDGIKDWGVPLATDIQIIDASEEECPEGWSPFYEKQWPGVDEGCVFDGDIYAIEDYR